MEMIAAKAKAGANQDANGQPTEVQWGIGEMEFESYMRMMDQAVKDLEIFLFTHLGLQP